MPRYLTPTRLVLLCLIGKYTQSDSISPDDALSVLDFIASQIVHATDAEDQGNFGEISRDAKNLAIWAQPLKKFSAKEPGRTVFDAVVAQAWTLRGLDMLELHIEFIRDMVIGHDVYESSKATITPASPIGQFIRRCRVEFTRLHFADSQALWNAYKAFRAPTFQHWAARSPKGSAEYLAGDPERDILPPNPQLDRSDLSQSSIVSTADADQLLNFAIHQLQKHGTRVPQDVKMKLEQWIGDECDPSIQTLNFFMAFFEHWKAGQYTMALESLHRYFDYSVASTARNNTQDVKVYYQYALLHLSVLHADFECWDESIEAMNECIVTARETNDTACLNYALSWLLYLRHSHPRQDQAGFGASSNIISNGGNELEEIAILKNAAKEGRHWFLLSSTLLAEAKLLMHNGAGVNRAREHILQALYLIVQHDLRSMLPAAYLFLAASWDRTGQPIIANFTYAYTNLIHENHCPLNDEVRALGRIVQAYVHTGNYSLAILALTEMREQVRGVLKLDQSVTAFMEFVTLTTNLHRGELEAANHHLAQLRPLSSFGDPEVVFEIKLLELEMFLRQRLFEAAFTKVNAYLAQLKGPSGDIAHRLQLLVFKSRILATAGQAGKGFTIALRSTLTAKRHHLISIFLEGLCVLGRILVELSEFTAARDILGAAIPSAWEVNDLFRVARLYVALGEAHVGIAGFHCEAASSEQIRNMRLAGQYIEQGRKSYERMQDDQGIRDCLVMKSRIARWGNESSIAAQADELYFLPLAEVESVSAKSGNDDSKHGDDDRHIVL